ncbi:hypothetical protein B0F88_11868 [Methylobacter tundripaludum]|uniref:Uncharacterized protein n=1 Tax=Methylobacter tundripaludum TaxID=173365 RepID=A0A2S6GLJ9_9GAMM|nr:hypothetical protein [Methylobacter tundripaludum]PPK66036.1 hypothetical protein B0F88_11868 [Methylobacter tundripaludum]
MSLLDQIKVEVPNEYKEAIQFIDDFDYEPILKKVSKDLHGPTKKYVFEGIENLKRYYVVALLDAQNPHAVSRPVDPFWHVHVLFSREYFRFCEEVFGAYVHHIPLDHDDSKAVSHVKKVYEYTLKKHHEIFKQVDEEWWPAATMPGLLICFQPEALICFQPEACGYRLKGLYEQETALRESV